MWDIIAFLCCVRTDKIFIDCKYDYHYDHVSSVINSQCPINGSYQIKKYLC